MTTQNEFEIFTKGTCVADAYEVCGRLGKGGMALVYSVKVNLKNFDFPALMAHYSLRQKGTIGAYKHWRYYYNQWRKKSRKVIRQIIQTHRIPYPRGQCALKVMLPGSPQVARFKGEWQYLISLQHPNLIEVYEGGTWQGYHYYVMELIEHPLSLSAMNMLDLLEKTDIILQAARGLQVLHESGIVHRDVKPANLFVYRSDDQLRVKIADLGIAKYIDTSITLSQQIIGTPHFMPPEQVQDSRSVDARADIYSLGATFYNLLTGHPPYHQDNFHKILLKVQAGTAPAPICRTCPEVPDFVEELVRRMMVPNPQKRFQSMGEVLAALQHCRDLITHPPEPTVLPETLVISRVRPTRTKEVRSLNKGSKRRHPAALARLPSRRQTRQRDFSHYLITAMPLLCVALLLGVLWLLGAGAQSATVSGPKIEPLRTPTRPPTISAQQQLQNLIKQYCQALTKGQSSQARVILRQLDNFDYDSLKDITQLPALARLIVLFYRQQWAAASQLAPEIVKQGAQATAGLGMWYCIRLFVCTGEYSLAIYYTPMLYATRPHYYNSLPQPIGDICQGFYCHALEQLNKWSPTNTFVQVERKFIEIFLNITLYRYHRFTGMQLKHVRRLWQSIPTTARHGWRLYQIMQHDYRPNINRQRLTRQYQDCYEKAPFSIEAGLRAAALLLEAGRIKQGLSICQKILQKYPHFAPAQIITGDYSVFQSNNRRRMHDIYKEYLYACICAYQRCGQRRRSLKVAGLLVKYFPKWYFSFIYYGRALLSLRNFQGMRAGLKGLRMAPLRLVNDYLTYFLKIFGRQKVNIAASFEEYVLWLLEELPNYTAPSSPVAVPGLQQAMAFLRQQLHGSQLRDLYLYPSMDPGVLQKALQRPIVSKIAVRRRNPTTGQIEVIIVTHPFLLGMLARSYSRVGEHRKAILYFQQAQRLWPHIPQLQRAYPCYLPLDLQQGYHYFSFGVTYLKQLQRTPPPSPMEIRQLTLLAFKCFQKARQIDPDYALDSLFHAKLLQLVAYLRQHHLDKAALEVIDWSLRNLSYHTAPFLQQKWQIQPSMENLKAYSDRQLGKSPNVRCTNTWPLYYLEQGRLLLHTPYRQEARQYLRFALYLLQTSQNTPGIQIHCRLIKKMLQE